MTNATRENISNPPAVHIPDDAWTECDGRDFLVATMLINGTAFHLNAYRLRDDYEGMVQQAVKYDDELSMIHNAVGADGHWDTVAIGGWDYIIIAEPFS